MAAEYFRRIIAPALADVDRLGARLACEYCDEPVSVDVAPTAARRATVDHRVPLARGGTDHQLNLAICCFECNQRKGALTHIEFRALRYDPAALKAEVARVQTMLDCGSESEAIERVRTRLTNAERRAARRVEMRQDARLDCPSCEGNGYAEGNTRRDVLCHCCLHPEHIRGRPPKLWQRLNVPPLDATG